MDPKTNNIDDLKSQISSTEAKIKEAEGIIELFKERKLKYENPSLIRDENDILDFTHQSNGVDIKLYNEKILKLQKEVEKNGQKLLKLREENAKLKKEKNIETNNPEPEDNKNRILNLKDLTQSINLIIRTESKDVSGDIDTITSEENIKMENAEVINKKIKEYEKVFEELKEKGNQISSFIDKQNEAIKENRNYLNDIQNYVSEFKERLNISINNQLIDNDNKNLKLKDYNNLFETASNKLFELDNILLENKDKYGPDIEYNLTNIQMNINSLNNDENKNEINFKNKCEEIDQIIEAIKKIYNDFEKNKIKFDIKNKSMEEEMKNLKNLHNEEIIKQNKKKEENAKKNEKKQDGGQNGKNTNDKGKKKLLGQSLLYKAKDANKKLDIFKTINVFQKKDELEEDLEESKLLRKNYHEICYVYDDYDIHDIYYTLKAVVLANYGKFSLANFYFNGTNKIEIQEFDLDDIPSEYKLENNIILSFKIELYDMQSLKVHMKYKEIRDSNIINTQGKKQSKIYRTDEYGLDNTLSGANAKYSLILKGNDVIVNFEDYFLIRNTENNVDVEYMWGGIVPPQGKMTKITFSKREANWSFERVIKFHSNSFIKKTKFYIPVEFVGGNNEIIKITPLSSQANEIILDDKKRQYIIKFTNTKHKKAELIIKGEFKNLCTNDWNVDLTDKEIEKLMPEEDVKDKEQLKKIAKKIIEEFDKENKDSDFEYLDYMKIGLWIKKNIKYSYGSIGKKCSALKIYKMKAGVAYHYTRLCNALLYSLGYKVLYASGYYCKSGNKFDQYNIHAFSLINLQDNKWHPFDVTYGIFTGKLHVGYVFRMFDSKDVKIENNNIILDKNEMNGVVIN